MYNPGNKHTLYCPICFLKFNHKRYNHNASVCFYKTTTLACNFCGGDHKITNCGKFAALRRRQHRSQIDFAMDSRQPCERMVDFRRSEERPFGSPLKVRHPYRDWRSFDRTLQTERNDSYWVRRPPPLPARVGTEQPRHESRTDRFPTRTDNHCCNWGQFKHVRGDREHLSIKNANDGSGRYERYTDESFAHLKKRKFSGVLQSPARKKSSDGSRDPTRAQEETEDGQIDDVFKEILSDE